jgi:hypothetical protein
MTAIVNAALAVYGIQQGQKAPNFYIAPTTPTEQWRTDASQSLYNSVAGYTNQYLQGLGNLQPNFSMPNSNVGNPAFMGGIQVPKINFSTISPIGAIPSTTTPTSTGTTQPSASAGTGSGPTGQLGDPFGTQTSPAGSSGDPFANLPGGGGVGDPTAGGAPPAAIPDGTTPAQQGAINGIWQWMQANPGIVKGGEQAVTGALGIATGPVGAYVGMLGSKLLNAFISKAVPLIGSTTPTPTDPNSVNPADLAGAPQLPPAGTLPIKNPNYPTNILTPGGTQPTPRLPITAPGATDPWSPGFGAGITNGPGGGPGWTPFGPGIGNGNKGGYLP